MIGTNIIILNSKVNQAISQVLLEITRVIERRSRENKGKMEGFVNKIILIEKRVDHERGMNP